MAGLPLKQILILLLTNFKVGLSDCSYSLQRKLIFKIFWDLVEFAKNVIGSWEEGLYDFFQKKKKNNPSKCLHASTFFWFVNYNSRGPPLTLPQCSLKSQRQIGYANG